MTQVTLTQPLANTSPFIHGSGNILASHFTHMHMPSALLGHTIDHMANNYVIHTTMVKKTTHSPTQLSYMSTPNIGGQSSMEW